MSFNYGRIGAILRLIAPLRARDWPYRPSLFYSFPPLPYLSGVRKNIAILGSTGSIGCNALEAIESLGAPYRAVALSGHRNLDKLAAQVRRHRPAAIALTDHADEAAELRLREYGAQIYRGARGMVEMVQRDDVDVVLAAVVGAAGLPAVLAAVRSGKALALANT